MSLLSVHNGNSGNWALEFVAETYTKQPMLYKDYVYFLNK